MATNDVLHPTRARRGVTVVIAIVVTAVVVAAVWWWTSGSDRVDPSDQPAGPPAPASDAPAAAFAVAVRAPAEQVHGPGPVPVIYLLDRTCPDVMSAPPVDTDCVAPISAELRRNLTAALASFSRVEFVGTAAAVTGPDLEVADGGVLTMLGQARFSAGSGEFPLAVRKGGLNGRGMTYYLSYQDGRWRITGSGDSAWIS